MPRNKNPPRIISGWARFIGGGGPKYYKLPREDAYWGKVRKYNQEDAIRPTYYSKYRLGRFKKTIEHLQICTVQLKDEVKELRVVLAHDSASRVGTSEFLNVHLPQLRFNNPNVHYALHEFQPGSKIRVYFKSPEDSSAVDNVDTDSDEEADFDPFAKEEDNSEMQEDTTWKKPPPDVGKFEDMETEGLMPHEIMDQVCQRYGKGGEPGTCTSKFKWSEYTESPVDFEAKAKAQHEKAVQVRRALLEAEKKAKAEESQEQVEPEKPKKFEPMIDLSELAETDETLSAVYRSPDTIEAAPKGRKELQNEKKLAKKIKKGKAPPEAGEHLDKPNLALTAEVVQRKTQKRGKFKRKKRINKIFWS